MTSVRQHWHDSRRLVSGMQLAIIVAKTHDALGNRRFALGNGVQSLRVSGGRAPKGRSPVQGPQCMNIVRERMLEQGSRYAADFYDFPAEHWKHLRTTSPFESTFATVRHSTIRSRGGLSNRTALAMVFKVIDAAQKNWRPLDDRNQLPKLILGVKFAEARGGRKAGRPSAHNPRRLTDQAVTKNRR